MYMSKLLETCKLKIDTEGKRVVNDVNSRQISCDVNKTLDRFELKSSVRLDGEMTLHFKSLKPDKNKTFYIKMYAHR